MLTQQWELVTKAGHYLSTSDRNGRTEHFAVCLKHRLTRLKPDRRRTCLTLLRLVCDMYVLSVHAFTFAK